jgi:transposase
MSVPGLPEGMSLAEVLAEMVELRRVVAAQAERITELERRLAADSSNSSRPPSSDAPWEKKPAKKRSSRGRSGRKPGKQPGASSVSRSLVDNPDQTVVIEPGQCRECASPLAGAAESGRERRQVVDVGVLPPPEVTEYQRVSKICRCCGW